MSHLVLHDVNASFCVAKLIDSAFLCRPAAERICLRDPYVQRCPPAQNPLRDGFAGSTDGVGRCDNRDASVVLMLAETFGRSHRGGVKPWREEEAVLLTELTR
jgi:hypothetical protein